MRNTKQKELILNIINHSNTHPTAFEVYEEAKKELHNISLGTVYRNLNVLLENKKIIQIKGKEIFRRSIIRYFTSVKNTTY